jgi:hypothetical protein
LVKAKHEKQATNKKLSKEKQRYKVSFTCFNLGNEIIADNYLNEADCDLSV